MDQIVAALKNVGLGLYANGRVKTGRSVRMTAVTRLLSNLTHAVRHDPVLCAGLG